MANTTVVPGQPLHHLNNASASSSSKNVAYQAGKGSFVRNSSIYASIVGTASKEGGLVSVVQQQQQSSSNSISVIPETGSVVCLLSFWPC
jgi:exosome complex RNA-binding protein Rrp4